jgi:iron-sulfur cluster assembly protein
MAITLTKNAAEHVKNMLDKRGYGLGLRLATCESGCSGLSYEVDYADETNEEDVVFECHNIKVIVDSQSLQYVDGIEIDYGENDGVNKVFKFQNPNTKSMCGCGESFNV